MTTDERSSTAQTEWPEASRFRRSIRFEFAIYVTAMLLVLMFVTGYVITNNYVETVTSQVVKQLLVQARSYSAPAGKLIISSDKPDALLLNNILKRLTSDNPDIHWAGISDKDGVFLAHTDIKQVIALARLEPFLHEANPSLLGPGERLNLQADTISISVPIRENDIRLGALTLASSTGQISRARSESITTVVTITVIMMLIGLPIALVVFHWKLRPVSVITKHLKEMSFDRISLDIPITTRDEFGYLAQTLHVMGSKLNSAQLERIERERINRELEIAREIQQSILPKGYPSADSFEIAGTYRSAREVGGDYYDFIEYDDEHLGVLVADVSGKSLPGMLVMLLTRDIVKKLARQPRQPAELLTEVNAELCSSIHKGMFVTMFFGILHKSSGLFSFASAGHNPLIRFSTSANRYELIKTHGFPLGMMPHQQFAARIENAQVNLDEGDWLIQYTDGVNEARNAASEEFGMDRFQRLIESGKSMNPNELVDTIASELDSFAGDAPQYDDITLLVLKWVDRTVDKSNTNKADFVNVNAS